MPGRKDHGSWWLALVLLGVLIAALLSIGTVTDRFTGSADYRERAVAQCVDTSTGHPSDRVGQCEDTVASGRSQFP